MSKPKSYSVSEFKAKSLGLIEEVSKSGKPLTITKRGVPIAQVIPIKSESTKPVLGKLSHTVIHMGDIVSPLGADMWEAAKD